MRRDGPVEHDLAAFGRRIERLTDAVPVLSVVLRGDGDEQMLARDIGAGLADQRVFARPHVVGNTSPQYPFHSLPVLSEVLALS